MTLVEAKAALERGRPVVLVRPPAVERALEVWELLPAPVRTHGEPPAETGPMVLICADDASAADWAVAAPAGLRVHAVTGLARSRRILAEGAAHVVAGAAKDLAALVGRSALKLDHTSAVVLAWPEALVAGEHAAVLDSLLSEARAARRIVLTWNPAALSDFLERHARRALIVGMPGVGDAAAVPPVTKARFVVVARARRAIALRDALDALAARAPFVWSGGPIAPPPVTPDAVICSELPTREELGTLAALGEPIVFATAGQLPYLRSIASLTPLTLPGAVDRARDRAEALRERVTRVLASRNVDAELTLLEPLLERFDPAEVAAALLTLMPEGAAAAERGGPEAPGPGPTRVFVNVGKKDRAGAKDLVGALIREAGIAKGEIGRIEVRETFSIVEVAASAVGRAVEGLRGVTIRGRRALARLDRGET